METLLFELLISGFFAVACIRASVRANPGGKLAFSDLFRFCSFCGSKRGCPWCLK
jgi:hypothetical protein